MEALGPVLRALPAVRDELLRLPAVARLELLVLLLVLGARLYTGPAAWAGVVDC